MSWRNPNPPNTSWRESLADARESVHDAYAPDEAAFDVRFYDGYGGEEGPHVLAWSETHVYFPVGYDGSEWIGSAPRNPVPDGQPHVGG